MLTFALSPFAPRRAPTGPPPPARRVIRATTQTNRALEAARRPPARAPLRVRAVHTSELCQVADIRCNAFYTHPHDLPYHPARRREIHAAVRDKIAAGNVCLVVCEPAAGRVVGSVDASLHDGATGRRMRFEDRKFGDVMYVSSMAVRPEWQRKGFATCLIHRVLVIARQLHVPHVFLHVESHNSSAVRVYQKKGFEFVHPLLQHPSWLSSLAKKEHALMNLKLPQQ